MMYPNSSVPKWFGKGRRQDPERLDAWRAAPLTYSPGQDLDHHWNLDRYEVLLGKDFTGQLFQRAAQLTLTNQFYPPEVMVNASDFQRENRIVRPGDRVLQRIRILQPGGFPLYELLTMNEITEVIDEPRRAGFTYTTTSVHSEMGEWSPQVVWRENGEVWLLIEVVSRPLPGASRYSRQFTRRMQLRAHKLSIQNFISVLTGSPRVPVRERPAIPTDLIPVGMLVTALILFLATVFSYSRRQR